jgi:hypothetical protein
MDNPRRDALADCEAIIAAHQPDEQGFCRASPDVGGRIRYPCRPLLFTEDAANRLRWRIDHPKGVADA